MLLSFKKPLGMLLVAALLVGVSFSLAVAQDVPTLSENQKSVILFDVRVDKVIAEAKELGSTEGIDNLPMDGPFEGLKPTDFKRVFGSASLPKDMNFIGAMMMGPPADLPLEFFVRFEFNDADAVEKLEKQFAEISETTKINGKEYLRPPNGPLVLAHRIDETTFEIGTKAYCLQAKRNFYTDTLSAAFKSAPDEPLRIVIDLESRADFIKEAVDMGKAQMKDAPGGAVIEAYLDLIDNAKSIVLTQSMAGENLVTTIIDGVNKDEAEELKGGLDSLLGTAKLGAGPGLMQMQSQMSLSDKSIGVLKSMVDGLAATQDGTTVRIAVKKPEGFADVVKEIQTAAQAQAKVTQKMNNFRQLGLAALNFESAYQKFPFNADTGIHDGFSWRVKVLPFLEEQGLYDDIQKETSPTDDSNAKFAEKMPAFYGTDGKNSRASWIQSGVETFGNITDGSSNTIMLIENPNAGPWMQNKPISIDEAVKLVTSLKDGEELVAVMYDCSARMLNNKADKENLRNMFDPADGNRVNHDR